MAAYKILEVFGYPTSLVTDEATKIRTEKWCRFLGKKCNKDKEANPLGACTIYSDSERVTVCPSRFLENDLIFRAVGKEAFGEGAKCAVFPEVKLLKDVNTGKKTGKVDFLIGEIHDNTIVNFAAIELQGVYISGNIRDAFEKFLETGEQIGGFRPDFRSSGPKRLMPQLENKVPVFRRWGIKFFVIVDTFFSEQLPMIKETSKGNSEVTWLICDYAREGNIMKLNSISPKYTIFEDVQAALRTDIPPEKSEILGELREKFRKGPPILKC